MKKLIMLGLLISTTISADFIINNESNQSIQANLHSNDTVFFIPARRSNKIVIPPYSTGKLSKNEIYFDYISFHIQSGPFKGIGTRLDWSAVKKTELNEEMGSGYSCYFNRANLYSLNHRITVNILHGLPVVTRVDFIGRTVPSSWWKISHTPQDAARAQDILYNQKVKEAAYEQISDED